MTEQTTMQTLTAFIASVGLTMTVERTDHNPHMTDSAEMDHWHCILRRGRMRITVYFSKGYGHHGAEPTLSEVLSCMASDASSADESFEDWASIYDYDTDSRKAERTYKIVQRQTTKLKTLLGPEAFETLLYQTERD